MQRIVDDDVLGEPQVEPIPRGVASGGGASALADIHIEWLGPDGIPAAVDVGEAGGTIPKRRSIRRATPQPSRTPRNPMKAFQDYYTDNVSHCYGCGSLNVHGHRIKTFWDGDETVTRFTPKPWHTAVPGYTYGGLIASLIDCHSTGTAAAAMYRSEGRAMDTLPPFRFVTGSLQVSYLKPTPIGGELVIRGTVKEIKGRKVVVETTVLADGVATARGTVVAVQMPEDFGLDRPRAAAEPTA